MSNKRSVSLFSALLIVVFHLWVPVFGKAGIEHFVKQTAYIGVDMFFFLSGLSLASRKIENYGEFVCNRFLNVYGKFVLFAIVAAIYVHWKPILFLQVISGVNLFKRGGGAFLWFLPAIMLLYLVYPAFQKMDTKNRGITALTVTVIWVAGAVLWTKLGNKVPIAIFWNRIPIFFLGHFFAGWDKLWTDKRLKLSLGVLLSGIGTVLVYFFAYRQKLQFPVRDAFYLTVLPLSIGLVLLVSFVPENAWIKRLGKATLELYALQMIFGFKLANMLYMKTESAILTNLLTFGILLLGSVLLSCISLWKVSVKKS